MLLPVVWEIRFYPAVFLGRFFYNLWRCILIDKTQLQTLTSKPNSYTSGFPYIDFPSMVLTEQSTRHLISNAAKPSVVSSGAYTSLSFEMVDCRCSYSLEQKLGLDLTW